MQTLSPAPPITDSRLLDVEFAANRANRVGRLAGVGITAANVPTAVRERVASERRYYGTGWAWATLFAAAEQPTKANLLAAVREALAVLSADDLLGWPDYSTGSPGGES